MNFKRFGRTNQLFDVSTAIDGYGISNGKIIKIAGYTTSDYVPVISGATYIASNSGSTVLTYNASKIKIGVVFGLGTGITIPTNVAYIRFNMQTVNKNNVMLNLGSDPLPYEPYGYLWSDIPHYIHNTSTDTITTLPADVYADGNNATVGIQGNMEQTGTPTPTTPIQPSECGERTGNLFDKNATDTNKGYIKDYMLQQDGTTLSWNVFSTSEYMEVSPNTAYYLSNVMNAAFNAPSLCFYDDNKDYISGVQYQSRYSFSFTTPNNAKYVRISYTNAIVDITMLSVGSTAPSEYEPYGQYKIPILNNSQTTNVYLGEVESTRQIKQLMLTGNENISETTIGSKTIFQISQATVSDKKYGVATETMICSHYKVIDGRTNLETNDNAITTYNASNNNALLIRDDNCETLTDFTTYLTQQYSAGTPVTLWYVLATETTGIVNEPLMKIGTYADEVSDITIPTIAGANNFDVLTTLKPSEVSLAYTGWHDASVKEWDGSEWQ